ncbi:coenzyme A transferase family protein [Paraburkholderia fungorum]|uniref:Acetate CoA-transferase YdiF n=1 Tax=Paraburkholderia fungorum TaxID=134537 RepID=A0AAU8SZD6_9BURK|nr:CoA-transferase [Paraburkholderia fungorum]AJZ56859.1 coenzyme A transferase family protein [Paraburkholderia fungorum]
MRPGKQISAAEAAQLVQSGATVALAGLISLAVPEAVLAALGERFRTSGAPGGLTLLAPNRPGWKAEPATGLEHFAQPGMIQRVVTSTFSKRDSPRFVEMAVNGGFEAYSYPMGCLYRIIRETAAGSPGFLTQVGLNTYVDPAACDAGTPRVNEATPEAHFVSRVEIDGEPYLFYRSMPVNVAIIRGTVADPDGNISMAGEPVSVGMKYLAMAARNSGGKVIAQVKYLTERGALHPRMVEVPGILVDAVVVEPDSIQSQLSEYDPALSGEFRNPHLQLPPLPFDIRKVITRRALQEIRPGNVVNLGVGVGTGIPSVAREEGVAGHMTFSLEHGAIGGVPAMGTPANSGAFGAHYNPDAIVDSTEIFDFYHGGGLDVTVLGFAEIDRHGNVNVGSFGGNLRGPGGFLDIAHRTRTVLFCGTLTAGGLDVAIEAHDHVRVSIAREGRNRKFVEHVEQVNFHGPSAVAKGQRVLIVTERAVFQVGAAGLELIEIAPGLDVARQIRPAVSFDFTVSPALREMDHRLFRDSPMGLAAAFQLDKET